ncbi:MAG: GDSL-type esterase/lipase family protein [Gaiellaceae bacterium]
MTMRRSVLIAVLVLAVGSVLSSGATQASTSAPAVWKIVALGDSDTTGNGDPTRLGWVGRYARLLRQKLGLRVTVQNLAQDGTTSSQLLANVRSDPATRAALKEAQIVLLGIGGADLNGGDARLQTGNCKVEACYAPVLQAFRRNFDSTVALIRRLEGSRKIVLRAITPAISVIGAEDMLPPFLKPFATRISVYEGKGFAKTICPSMARHGGQCIDVLHPFNGPLGTDNAYKKGLMNLKDCCYPSAKGQQLMAELLFKTGLAPLR